ncbi:MAG: DUF4386 domain-containing protein [Anaerolineaceae bacterium]|nr:DUF4386 domain-containing protein [Anaerolineaceae bacterium]
MTTETTTHNKTAIIVGVLFIIATAFLYVGSAFYGPALDTPDYLQTAYPQRIQAAIGILIEFSCVLAIPLIAIFAFPVLKRYSLPLAISYIFFRAFESVLFILVDINKLALIPISRGYLNGTPAEAAFYNNLGNFIKDLNLWSWCFYVLVFGIGALIFYYVLFRSRLLPRWISIFGLATAALITASVVFSMFEVSFNLPYGMLELIFAMPIAVQEMVMAVWLIVKGFNPQVQEHASI